MSDPWEVGQTIDGLYEIFGAAAGGMGAVYFVNHLKWKIPLAVKTPLPALINSSSAYQRYIKEAETWINIGMHPHIVSCFYVRDLDGIPRIFIEYASGGTLKDLIDKKQLGDISYVLDLAIQFSMAMEYIHELGIIHRDIKPANCMITGDGELKVTDFGIAKLGDDVPDTDDNPHFASSYEGLTMTGSGFGTPEYMAPEQFLDAKNIGKEADIYSFGIMLYEMVCGVRPFVMPSGMNTHARDYFYRNAHFNEIPRQPIESNRRIPQLLNRMILKCLEKDVSKRFHSFRDISSELLNCCNEIGRPNNRIKPDVLKLKADSLNNKAISLLDLGKKEDAVTCWEQALKEDPQHLEATFNYGYYRWENGASYHEVLRAPMSNLLGTYENNPEFWRLLAWLNFEQGDIDALEKIQKSVHKVVEPGFINLCDELYSFEKQAFRAFKGHSDVVKTGAFSTDARYLITGSYDKTLRLWDVLTGRELKRFEGHDGWVQSVAFSPVGRYVLSGSISVVGLRKDNSLRLWDVATGKDLSRFEGHFGWVQSVAFSPDGRYVLSGGNDKILRLWVTSTGEEIKRFEGHNETIYSVAFSPDGNNVLSGSGDGTIRLWETESGKELRKFIRQSVIVNSVTFSPDGKYILSGDSKALILWEVATNAVIRLSGEYDGCVSDAAFSPDGKLILSYGPCTHRLWEVTTGKELLRFEGSFPISFSPDNKYIITGSGGKIIRLVSIESLMRLKNLTGVGPYPLLSKIRQTIEMFTESQKVSRLIASVTVYIEKGSVKEAYAILRKTQAMHGYERNKQILDLINFCVVEEQGNRRDLRTGWYVGSLVGQSGSVKSVVFSPSGRQILSGGGKTIRLWEVAIGKEIRCFEGHSESINSVAFSPDGKYVLSGSGTPGRPDSTIRLWDAVAGTELRRFEGHNNGVRSVAFSPNGRYALSGSWDNTLRLWEITTGKEIRRFEGHSECVNSVAYSQDGRYALSGSNDNSLKLWETLTGKEIRQFDGHSKSVNSVKFSPDSKLVLSGSWDKTVRLWETRTGKELWKFEGHSGFVESVAFSPDGRYALSGGDSTIRLWDVVTGKEIKRFDDHSLYVKAVAFSPDARYIISANSNNLLLWELDWDWEFPKSS
jgi:WD40 repeat protein/serine/threonine protein kinase